MRCPSSCAARSGETHEWLSVEGDTGLGDSADTGRLFGFIMPVTHALRVPRVQLDLRPDSDRRRVDGHAEAVLHLVPVMLLVSAAQLGWRVFVARA